MIEQPRSVLRLGWIIAQNLHDEIARFNFFTEPLFETESDRVVDRLACISAAASHRDDRLADPLAIHSQNCPLMASDPRMSTAQTAKLF